MSAISGGGGSGAGLGALYTNALDHHDPLAVSSKREHWMIWLVIAAATWLPLFSAIAGMALVDHAHVGNFVLKWFVPACGFIVGVCTAIQVVIRQRSKWLASRAAAEQLKRECMLYRFGLPPYDVDDADAVLDEEIRGISERARSRKVNLAGDSVQGDIEVPYHGTGFRFVHIWHYIRALITRRKKTPDTAKDISPRFLHTISDDAITAAVEGRLQNQEQWHLRKAQRYAGLYLLVQLIIIVANVGNSWYTMSYGGSLALVATVTGLNLALISGRDFFGWGPLFIDYMQVVCGLKWLRQRYESKKLPFHLGTDVERLQLLIKLVERLLSNEFRYWYAGR